MKKQIFSFKCALRGVLSAVKTQSHMRFHIAAAFYVLLFSVFYNFSAVQTALLCVLIAGVMAAEIINTSIEALCDFAAPGYEPLVRVCKDAAAGAVLVMSAAAVVVAVLFFADIETISEIIGFFVSNPLLLAALILSAALSCVFVAWGIGGTLGRLRRLKKK